MTSWERKFYEACKFYASWSKDPTTKVGCIIVSDDNSILVQGYNGVCRGVDDKEERNERPIKYKFYEHAERNAIFSAARNGITLKGLSIYSLFFPCPECTRAIIQSGLKKLFVFKDSTNSYYDRYDQDLKISKVMLDEAGVYLNIIDI